MASTLAATSVSIYTRTNTRPGEWYPMGKDNRAVITRSLVIASLAHGDATDVILASSLGFETILQTSSLWDATNSKGYPAVIDPTVAGGMLLLLNGDAAPVGVKVTATLAYITVTGTVKIPSAT